MCDRIRVLGESGRKLKLAAHVGFDSLPDQLVNRRKADGFTFNILVIGEAGIGKSALIDSLFKTSFEEGEAENFSTKNGVELKARTFSLEEKGVDLRLTVVHAQGFGVQINCETDLKPIIDYVESRFQEHLRQELKAERDIKSFRDSRIHACLYMLSPTGHSLKSIDLVAMRALHRHVNIIPLIAKSDTVSQEELDGYKKRINDELEKNDILIYEFPTDEGGEIDAINSKLNREVPFAVVGSKTEINMGGQKVRVRQYPWGIVEVENEAHSDFSKLRDILIRTNMEDLVNRTHLVHFEHYRQENLAKMGFASSEGDATISEAYERKKLEHEREMKRIEENIRQNFVARVKEKDNELQRAGKDLLSKFERLMLDVKQQMKDIEEQDSRINFELEQIRSKNQSLSEPKKKDKKDKEKEKSKG